MCQQLLIQYEHNSESLATTKYSSQKNQEIYCLSKRKVLQDLKMTKLDGIRMYRCSGPNKDIIERIDVLIPFNTCLTKKVIMYSYSQIREL